MAPVDVHVQDCKSLLDRGFEDVHRWLDKYAMDYPPPLYLEYHRKFRHNEAGVKEVLEKWGPLAEDAAKVHLVRDVEIYILQKPMVEVLYDELDDLVKRSYEFFPPIDARKAIYSNW